MRTLITSYINPQYNIISQVHRDILTLEKQDIDLSKCGIYMNYCTYNNIPPYRLIGEGLGTIFALPIRLDNKLMTNYISIREETDEAMDYCKNDVEITKSLRPWGKVGCGDLKRPTRYIQNDDATILFWADGSKTVVKRAKDDSFDSTKGFLWAYFLKHSDFSRTQANKYLDKVKEEVNK